MSRKSTANAAAQAEADAAAKAAADEAAAKAAADDAAASSGESNPDTPQGPETTGAASPPASAAAEAAAAPVAPMQAEVPLSFIGPEEEGETILIVSPVQIDGVDVRQGLVTVPATKAEDIVRAGAASRRPPEDPLPG